MINGVNVENFQTRNKFDVRWPFSAYHCCISGHLVFNLLSPPLSIYGVAVLIPSDSSVIHCGVFPVGVLYRLQLFCLSNLWGWNLKTIGVHLFPWCEKLWGDVCFGLRIVSFIEMLYHHHIEYFETCLPPPAPTKWDGFVSVPSGEVCVCWGFLLTSPASH